MSHVAAFCAFTTMFMVMASGGFASHRSPDTSQLDRMERNLGEVNTRLRRLESNRSLAGMEGISRLFHLADGDAPEQPPALGPFSRLDSLGHHLRVRDLVPAPRKRPYLTNEKPTTK